MKHLLFLPTLILLATACAPDETGGVKALPLAKVTGGDSPPLHAYIRIIPSDTNGTVVRNSDAEHVDLPADPLEQKFHTLFRGIPYSASLKSAKAIKSLEVVKVFGPEEEIPMTPHPSDFMDTTLNYGELNHREGKPKEKWFVFTADHKSKTDDQVLMFISYEHVSHKLHFMPFSLKSAEIDKIIYFTCPTGSPDAPKNLKELTLALQAQKLAQSCTFTFGNKSLAKDIHDNYDLSGAYDLTVERK